MLDKHQARGAKSASAEACEGKGQVGEEQGGTEEKRTPPFCPASFLSEVIILVH